MNVPDKPKRVLIFSQTFVPDPASVGQHMTDVAVELARRGHEVRVYTSARGYEDPAVRYPPRETFHGVHIRRLPLAGFGKKNLPIRILGTFSFLCQCIFVGLFTPRVAGIFFSTSPPLIGAAACIARVFRRVPVAYWAMDLNPDQLIAMGKIKPTSPAARVLEFVHRQILKRSQLIVALDRFMAQRINRRGDFAAKMLVMPPWPHDDNIESVDPATNPFRIKHALTGKFVIMYSGNHSPANPLTTLLQAAVRLKGDDSIRFVFVGGGGAKKEVDQAIASHGLTNMLSLPYQPLSELKYSLAAADIHVVTMGDNMVGIVHPCKIYGAMAVGRPILFLGPEPSHIADIMAQNQIGWHVSHGDVSAALRALSEIRDTPPETLRLMGRRAQAILRQSLSQQILCDSFVSRLESALGVASRTAAMPTPRTAATP